MPVYPAATLPVPNFWTAFGHSYFQYAFGTRTPAGRADAVFRNLLNVDHTSWKNFSVAGSRLKQHGASTGGWVRPMSTVIGAPPGASSSGAPYVAQGGAYILCWGINDVGFDGNTAKNCTAYANVLTAVISRLRCSVFHNPSDASVALSGFTTFGTATPSWIDQSSTGVVAYGSAVNNTVTITLPADYNGEPVVIGFIVQPGTIGGTMTYTGTAGVTGTTYSSSQTLTQSGENTYLCRRITTLTASAASKTIVMTASSFDNSGNDILFDGWWIEADNPPPVIVCNTPQLQTLGYSIYSASYTVTALSGTNVSATPTTITIAAGTWGLPTVGSATMPSTGGTVTISWTGSSATTLTGCTASGGSGTYSSNTLSWAGPTDADVIALNAVLPGVVANFDGMVQIADIDTAIGNNAAFLGSDGLHPNDEGAARIADALVTALKRCIPNTGLGTAISLEQASQRVNALIRPMVSGGWYTVDSFGGPQTGAASPNNYTMVTGDWWAIPFMLTQPWLRWINWAVDLVAYGSGSPSILVGFYDDKAFSGYPNQAFGSPAQVTPFLLGTSTGVKISPSSGAGSVNLPMDPGLYWVVIGVVAAGTGCILRSVGGPSPYVPQVGANAADLSGPAVAYKVNNASGTYTTAAGTSLPNTFYAMAASGAVPANFAPCVSLLMQ